MTPDTHMKYWTEKDLEHVREFLPTGVTADVCEISRLDDGDFFGIIIERYGASVFLELCKSDVHAAAVQMPVYMVEEDRYESRWREKFGSFDNAIRRCIELVRDPTKMNDLLNATQKAP